MTTTTSFAVIGMTCGHCVSSITRALTDLEGFVSVDVTLLPKGADSGASLPNTGGSNLSLLLLGGGLLLVGGGVTYLARRRSSSH